MKKGRVVIDRNLCKGCYLCTVACPLKLIAKDSEAVADGTYPAKASPVNADGKACIACGNCYTVCPDAAITVYEEEGAA